MTPLYLPLVDQFDYKSIYFIYIQVGVAKDSPPVLYRILPICVNNSPGSLYETHSDGCTSLFPPTHSYAPDMLVCTVIAVSIGNKQKAAG